ncbi:uncharacterized protein VTP21DRAFT_9353 [Calcarisporiella thermophila]|uniref:uncharacterized protein n=1 Tax=Calcarisporiella thermophila TaxID=911321 RepID=UPI0037436BBD
MTPIYRILIVNMLASGQGNQQAPPSQTLICVWPGQSTRFCPLCPSDLTALCACLFAPGPWCKPANGGAFSHFFHIKRGLKMHCASAPNFHGLPLLPLGLLHLQAQLPRALRLSAMTCMDNKSSFGAR